MDTNNISRNALTLIPNPHNKTIRFRSSIPELVRTGTQAGSDSIFIAVLNAYQRDFYTLSLEQKLIYIDKIKSKLFSGNYHDRLSRVYRLIQYDVTTPGEDLDFSVIQKKIASNIQIYKLMVEITPIELLYKCKNYDDAADVVVNLELWKNGKVDPDRRDVIIQTILSLLALVYEVHFTPDRVINLLGAFLHRNIYMIDAHCNLITCFHSDYQFNIVVLEVEDMRFETIGVLLGVIEPSTETHPKHEIKREFQSEDNIIKQLNSLR